MTGEELVDWIESIAEAVENAPLGHENRKRIFAKAIAELSAKERQRLAERLFIVVQVAAGMVWMLAEPDE